MNVQRAALSEASALLRNALTPMLAELPKTRAVCIATDLLVPTAKRPRPSLKVIARMHRVSRERVRQITAPVVDQLHAMYQEAPGRWPAMQQLLAHWRETPVPVRASRAHTEASATLRRLGLLPPLRRRVARGDYWFSNDEEVSELRDLLRFAHHAARQCGAVDALALRPLVPGGGPRGRSRAAALLEGQSDARSLDVDGAPRRWFWFEGTANGALAALDKLFALYASVQSQQAAAAITRALRRSADVRARGVPPAEVLVALADAQPSYATSGGVVERVTGLPNPRLLNATERRVACYLERVGAARRQDIFRALCSSSSDRDRCSVALASSPIICQQKSARTGSRVWGYYELLPGARRVQAAGEALLRAGG